MMNLFATLTSLYGFATENNCVWWGCGSLVGGTIVRITPCGRDRVEVYLHRWSYDCDGDCEYDTTTRTICRIWEVWEHIPAGILRGV